MRRNKNFPDIETAARLLDEEAEKLPAEIYRELNGGVNLLPEARRDASGLYTLGLYHYDAMGRYIELFYGSFKKTNPEADEDSLRQLLGETLRHELTHHLESLAGDRSLERWDEEHRAQLLRGLYDEDVNTPLFAGGQYKKPDAPALRRRRPVLPPEEK